MNEHVVDVLVAVLNSSGLVAVAVLAPFAAVISQRLKRVQNQVENNHFNPDGTPINLRDDLDGKHAQNRGALLALQRDVAWIMRRLVEQDDRLDVVETTLNPKENRR